LNKTVGDLRRRLRQKTQDTESGHRFAAARLAHEANRLPSPHLKADTVHRLGHTVVGVEVNLQIFDNQKRLVCHCFIG